MSKYLCSLLSGLFVMSMVGCRNCCLHAPSPCGVAGHACDKARDQEIPKELPKRNDSAVVDVSEAEAPSKSAEPAPRSNSQAQRQKRGPGPIFKTGATAAVPVTTAAMATGGSVKEPAAPNPSRGELHIPGKPQPLTVTSASSDPIPLKEIPGAAPNSQPASATSAASTGLARLTETWNEMPDGLRRAMLALEPDFCNNLVRISEIWAKMPHDIRRPLVALQPEGTESSKELAHLIDSWPNLSDAIRRAMVALEPEFCTNLALLTDTWPRLSDQNRRGMLALVESAK